MKQTVQWVVMNGPYVFVLGDDGMVKLPGGQSWTPERLNDFIATRQKHGLGAVRVKSYIYEDQDNGDTQKESGETPARQQGDVSGAVGSVVGPDRGN